MAIGPSTQWGSLSPLSQQRGAEGAHHALAAAESSRLGRSASLSSSTSNHPDEQQHVHHHVRGARTGTASPASAAGRWPFDQPASAALSAQLPPSAASGGGATGTASLGSLRRGRAETLPSTRAIDDSLGGLAATPTAAHHQHHRSALDGSSTSAFGRPTLSKRGASNLGLPHVAQDPTTSTLSTLASASLAPSSSATGAPLPNGAFSSALLTPGALTSAATTGAATSSTDTATNVEGVSNVVGGRARAGSTNSFGAPAAYNWPSDGTRASTTADGGAMSSAQQLSSSSSQSPTGEHIHRTVDYLGLDSDSSSPSAASPAAPEPADPRAALLRTGSYQYPLPQSALSPPAAGLDTFASDARQDGSNGGAFHAPGLATSTHSRLRSNTVATFPQSHAAVGAPQHHRLSLSNGSGAQHPLTQSPIGAPPSSDGYFGTPSSSLASARPPTLHRHSSLRHDLMSPSPTQSDSTEHPSEAPVPQEQGLLSHLRDSPHRGRAATIGEDPRDHLHSRLNAAHRPRAGTMGALFPPRPDGDDLLPRVRSGSITSGAGHAASLAGVEVIDFADRHHATHLARSASDIQHQQHQYRSLAQGIHGLNIAAPDDPALSSPASFSSLRADTPDEIFAAPQQQPTRSLWIGNLDPATNSQDLQRVFSLYGPIESSRVLPDKECGFVNFVTVNDAIQAKDDILNRRGFSLTKSGSMVRIGFGKADSAPTNGSTYAHEQRSTMLPNNNHGSSNNNNSSSSGAQFPAPNHGNGEQQLTPTRALWIGSIPANTPMQHLVTIFARYGPIESVRVLTQKCCAFINFERLEDAVVARKSLSGHDFLGPEVGPVRIGYAKVPTKPGATTNASAGIYDPYTSTFVHRAMQGMPYELRGMPPENYRSNLMMGMMGGDAPSPHLPADLGASAIEAVITSDIKTVEPEISELQMIVRELSAGEPDIEAQVSALATPRERTAYTAIVPLATEGRRQLSLEASHLRDVRKTLDSPCAQDVVDAFATEMMDETVELASDYIGNTVIQRIFERASPHIREQMLDKLAPHLASIGTHKNGTWAIQKLISCVGSTAEFALVASSLKIYTPALLLHDLGNYVVQGTLRFGAEHCDYIFDAMVDRCWEICSGRFGARSTRQTLENAQVDRLQVKRVAAALILNSVPLATNPNGSLLITWLLDTSNLPGRYSLLAQRFAPHLSALCTHKLASITILKIVNQKVDARASKTILDALFDGDAKVLEEILGDQTHGIATVTKLFNSSAMDTDERPQRRERVKAALTSLHVETLPAYRKLVEDLGMPVPSLPPPPPSHQAPQHQHQQLAYSYMPYYNAYMYAPQAQQALSMQPPQSPVMAGSPMMPPMSMSPPGYALSLPSSGPYDAAVSSSSPDPLLAPYTAQRYDGDDVSAAPYPYGMAYPVPFMPYNGQPQY